MKIKKVIVLGASKKKDRYSNIAARRLMAAGYETLLVSNKPGQINDQQFITDWPDLDDIHTITLYLNPSNQESYKNCILDSNAKRVVFNPGTENEDLYMALKDKGVEVLNACALVMLSTNQF